MRCHLAATESAREIIHRQRYDIFVRELGYLDAETDKTVEKDRYDPFALLLGVWDENELIASCRIVLPECPIGLPTVNYTTLHADWNPQGHRTAEISRITVAAGHRSFKKTIKVLQTMQHEIHRLSKPRGINQWIGAVEPGFLHLLARANLPYAAIGPLQHHVGADRYPVMLTAEAYLASRSECR